jgi:hypothetical protein
MAILKTRPGLEVDILVNGGVLTEYVNNEEPEDNSTVTKYVEAHSGKEFVVKYKSYDPFPQTRDVRFVIYLDGRSADSSCVRAEELYTFGGFTKRGRRSKTGTKSFTQNFLFRNLEISKCTLMKSDVPRSCVPRKPTHK